MTSTLVTAPWRWSGARGLADGAPSPAPPSWSEPRARYTQCLDSVIRQVEVVAELLMNDPVADVWQR